MGTLEQGFNLGNGSVQNAADIFRPTAFISPLLCNLENPAFCKIKQFVTCPTFRVVTGLGYFVGNFYHFPDYGTFPDDLRVGNYICRTGRIF